MFSPPSRCPATLWIPTRGDLGQGCQITLERLWLDYLVLGGSLAFHLFECCLAAEVVVGDVEHDLIALALNEHLLDHGLRFPVPYLRAPRRPADAGHRGTGATVPRSRARHRSILAQDPASSGGPAGSPIRAGGARRSLGAGEAPALRRSRSQG